jgi:hypothetical protein
MMCMVTAATVQCGGSLEVTLRHADSYLAIYAPASDAVVANQHCAFAE